jgi:hypothetical protein
MNFQSGNKSIQIVGCIIALLVGYYAYIYKNIVLGVVAAIMFFYDGYLALWEPQCICKYISQ